MLSPIPPRGTQRRLQLAPMAQGSLELNCRFAPGGASKAPGSIPGVVARHSPFSDGAKTHRGFS